MERFIEFFWKNKKLTNHEADKNFILCDIYPQRDMETSGIANLMKSGFKEGCQAWWDTPVTPELWEAEAPIYPGTTLHC